MRQRVAAPLAFTLAVALGGLLGWQLCRLLTPEPAGANRTFETRTHGGRREVRAEGRWYPLVERTGSPLERFVPPVLTPGQVVHLNMDGTALLTDEREASQRSQRDPGRQHGWPLPD